VLRVRVLAVLLALSALSGCAPGSVRVAMPGAVAPPAKVHLPASVRVQVREGSALVVRDVPIEQYVETTILSEVHPDVADEPIAERLFEVQAILARTYAAANAGRHAKDGFDLCSTTHCQLYEPARLKTSRWTSYAHEAARRTTGMLIWFGEQPAHAVFHADCGGHTSDAAAVWGGTAVPYLIAAPDECLSDHSEWTFEARVTALQAALNADARTNVGASLGAVEISGRDQAGRAELVTLRGTRSFVVRGEVFRDAVTHTFGAKSLKSTLFSVKRAGDRFVFSGRGFGHGVGLCQAGALTRIREGASTKDVLLHYFPGTVVR
jgi:stage II sporulation protein D